MVTTGRDGPKERLMGLKIFLSHSSKYRDLAIKVKLSLQALEAEETLDIRFSDDMAGATDWRQWIEDNVPQLGRLPPALPEREHGDGLVQLRARPLLRQQAADRLHQEHRHREPAAGVPALSVVRREPRQAREFLRELFHDGVFSDKVPINADVGNPGTEFYARGQEVANVLAASSQKRASASTSTSAGSSSRCATTARARSISTRAPSRATPKACTCSA
jgi:hypothetical protein